MKIGRPFNTFTYVDYFCHIENYKQYSDFNTLGLYRSIIENENLSTAEKKEIAAFAHKVFQKTFDFLQLKDPYTYFNIMTLGQELTQADSTQIWANIKASQQKILSDKKIKHRNFGDYSKHNCGIAYCHLNGIMIKQGTGICESEMSFSSDKNKVSVQNKSKARKKERKLKKQIIRDLLDE